MRQNFSPLLLIITLLLLLFPPLHAADFNIKIRKTDINELKQQIMPAFEQSIVYLTGLLNCLEHKKTTETCFEETTLHINEGELSADASLQKERNLQIEQRILDKIQEKNISPEQLTAQLKLFLIEAEAIKQCLNAGQTANDLKDCIMNSGNN